LELEMPLEPQAAVPQRCPKCGAALEVSSNMWGPFLRCDDCGHACDDYPDATVHVRGDRRSVAIQRANVRLAAVLMLPSGQPPYPCVIFVHGLGSGKDSPRNVVVASRIVDRGMAALLFDLSGHGESDTDPRPGEEPYIEDLAAAFQWAAGELEIDSERIGVAGSSLGAVVALSAIRRLLVRPAVLVLRAPLIAGRP
jgi:alpha-beta hydrolase superfamily lysophospholipase